MNLFKFLEILIEEFNKEPLYVQCKQSNCIYNKYNCCIKKDSKSIEIDESGKCISKQIVLGNDFEVVK